MPDNYSNIQDNMTSSNQVFFEKPKKSRRNLYIILGIALFILAVAGTVVFLLLNNKTTDTPEPEQSSASLAYVKTYKTSDNVNDGVTESIYESKNSSNSVIYKIQDGSWIAADDMANVATFASVNQSLDLVKSSYEAVLSNLKSDGFLELSSLDYANVQYSASGLYEQYFASEDMVCNLRNIPQPETDSAVASYTVRLDCASLSDFSSNKSSLMPFIEVYAASEDRLSQDVIISDPDIQASGTEGYNTASLDIYSVKSGDVSMAKFYQTTDKKWHLFTITADQDKVSCSSYSSEELINAYVGYTCWDSDNEESSFVARENPTFEVVPDAKG